MGTYTDEIIAHVRKNPGKTATEIARELRMSPDSTSATLQRLTKELRLFRKKNGKGTWIYSAATTRRS